MPSLAEGSYNAAIERCMRERFGAGWRVEQVIPSNENAMHKAARFCGPGCDAFVKIGTNPFSADQFRQEAWGLRYIAAQSPVKTPEVYGVLQEGDATLLVMEAIDARPPETRGDWFAMGGGLAALHRVCADYCGLETHSYLGIFYQNNTPMDTWAGFFGERRLRDSMQMAIDAGQMTPEAICAVEKLIARLPVLCDPSHPFSLLHGDPWIGNLLFDGQRLVLIDCSIYYGEREIDLSTVDLIRPVPREFFDAYNACWPVEPGYDERKHLWRVNQWLGNVTYGGQKYLPRLLDAVNRFI